MNYAEERERRRIVLAMAKGETPVTIENVKVALESIRALRGDDEVAHSLEDDLRDAVLAAVAAEHPDSVELARLALTTSDIEFARWCA